MAVLLGAEQELIGQVTSTYGIHLGQMAFIVFTHLLLEMLFRLYISAGCYQA